MPGMWAAVVMIVVSGNNGSANYIPFYDMAACQAAQAEIRPQMPWLSRTSCVPTVTGNPGAHNGH